ncbi:MAG: acetyl-CoA carboxylase carboxyl transferase subunit alpha/beta, partial [Desulfovibrionales bacterium]
RKRKAGQVYVRWSLNSNAKDRLVWSRYQKYRNLTQNAYLDKRGAWNKSTDWCYEAGWSVYSFLRYDIFGKHQKRLAHFVEDMEAEMHILKDRLNKGIGKIKPDFLTLGNGSREENKGLTELSSWDDSDYCAQEEHCYVSPQAKDDRTVSCPNAREYGCLDQWAPDLFGEWAGVCNCCGHHFPMEYQWYLNNFFDPGSIHEFNKGIEAGNPLKYEGLDMKLEETKKKIRQRSACMTFEARIREINVVVAMFMARFRGGSVGAAEGEKFIRAAERARKKHLPFIAYVHGTAGIRIQEGTNGVIQMPRCTLAVRRYMESGGLYLVLYDTKSYAGPVASFLGCSPYQFSIRSADIGFAGPGVIKETTGVDIPPDYHKAYNALSRGHIQGIWDRRESRDNLNRALLTMGGRNLYYR